MSPDRRLADLNPADRPTRAPGVAPPAPRVAPPQSTQPTDGQEQTPNPAQPSRGLPVTREKAAKVMHSVPVDVLDRLKQTAARSGRGYTDIVVGCLVDHREHLVPSGGHDATPTGALERRRQRADRSRSRTAQLTLYLTAAERAELDRLAAHLGIARSQLVTAALQTGLNDLP
jgi:hypothetical protein